jgi:hypothetical protein
MPLLHIKTFLIMAHLFGLTIGLGGATILDIIFLRLAARGKAVQQTDADLVALISKLVTWALVLLWVSGIGFLIQYWSDTPELLPNPKVYAKVSIVGLLTLNGIVLHARVLPIVYRNVGRPLFERLQSKEQFLMLACGTISMISWYTPFFLGIAREMNFVVPASWILAAYAGLVVAAISTALLLGPLLLRFAARRRAMSSGSSLVTAGASPGKLVVGEDGDEAAFLAAKIMTLRARVMAAEGDIEPVAAWQRIIDATPEILGTAPVTSSRSSASSRPAAHQMLTSSSRAPSAGSDCAA